jgi:two-component system CheB/CheR fusion protein
MPHRLLELWNNAKRVALPDAEPASSLLAAQTDRSDEAESALQDILANLRKRTGHDFRCYKRATMLRRIERRLQVNASRTCWHIGICSRTIRERSRRS